MLHPPTLTKLVWRYAAAHLLIRHILDNRFQVARVAPEFYWPFSVRVCFLRELSPKSTHSHCWYVLEQLFERQEEFFDIPASTLTPLQIREKLAALAAEVIPADKVDAFKEALKLKSSPNGGVAVTDDLKYTSELFKLESIIQCVLLN